MYINGLHCVKYVRIQVSHTHIFLYKYGSDKIVSSQNRKENGISSSANNTSTLINLIIIANNTNLFIPIPTFGSSSLPLTIKLKNFRSGLISKNLHLQKKRNMPFHKLAKKLTYYYDLYFWKLEDSHQLHFLELCLTIILVGEIIPTKLKPKLIFYTRQASLTRKVWNILFCWCP